MKWRFCRRFPFVVALAWLAAASSAGAQTVGATQVPEPETGGTVIFPDDQIFRALVADPKETSTFITFLRGRFRTLDDPSGAETNIAAIGVGDSFGLVRFGGPNPGDGLQLDVIGAIFAQFDVDSLSTDLINADYTIGLPVSFRRGAFSIRTKLYHQSSHLGDEFLLRDTGIDRENLSFESLEMLASVEAGPLRVYGGGERLLRREPEAVASKIFHGGLEVRTRADAAAQVVAGVDIKAPRLGDWSPATSARAGVAFRRTGSEGRTSRLVSFLLEVYEGPSPYGQFFQDDISYVGVGVHLGL
jgi:hypothetical protein